MIYWLRRPPLKNLIGFLLVVMLTVLLWFPLDWIWASRIFDGIDSGLLGRVALIVPLLIAILLVTRLYDRQPVAWTGLGVHRWMGRELLLGLILGTTMAVVAWIPAALTGTVSNAEVDSGYLINIAAYLLIGAFFEELAFRGYLFQRLVEFIGAISATILTSLLFAVAHLSNTGAGAFSTINTFLGGVFFALAYLRTGSLWLPFTAHFAWNFALAGIFGLPVSGFDFDMGLGVLNTVNSSTFLAGGTYGPEGGLSGTIALALGLWALASHPWIIYSPYVYARVFWENRGGMN